MNKKNVIIIGAGSHAKSVVDCLDTKKINLLGYIDNVGKNKYILGNDKFLLKKKNKNFTLINGIYFSIKNSNRIKIFNNYRKKNFKFLTVKSKKASISKDVNISEGSQILNGAIVNCGVNIGFNTVINTGSLIDHDVSIGNHCTISPGATICGNTNIGNNVNVGPGVIIFNNIKIGNNVFIQGGNVIRKNINSNKNILNKNAI